MFPSERLRGIPCPFLVAQTQTAAAAAACPRGFACFFSHRPPVEAAAVAVAAGSSTSGAKRRFHDISGRPSAVSASPASGANGANGAADNDDNDDNDDDSGNARPATRLKRTPADRDASGTDARQAPARPSAAPKQQLPLPQQPTLLERMRNQASLQSALQRPSRASHTPGSAASAASAGSTGSSSTAPRPAAPANRPQPSSTSAASSASRPSAAASAPSSAASSASRPAPKSAAGTAASAGANTKLVASILASPPIVKPDIHLAKVTKTQRQKSIELIFAEFVRIYTDIIHLAPSLAHDHAVQQESKMYQQCTTKSYTSIAVSILSRLRKRPLATSVEDTGIDGEWVPPEAAAAAAAADQGQPNSVPQQPSDSSSAEKRRGPVPLAALNALVMSESDLRNHQYPLSPFEDDAASATSKDASVSVPSGPTAAATVTEPKDSAADVQSPAPTAASTRDQAAQREGKTRTVCERCGCQYVPKYPLDEVDMEACHFHTGRILRERVDGQFQRRYTCCQEIVESSRRCAKGPHVFKEESNSLLHARIPFTKLAKDVANAQPVVALDCEMSYTTAGMEVTRVTITDWNGNSLLDELCRPDNPVLDLNTAWSGITSLESARYNLAGIRAQMDKFMSQDTIIIGHGLENDMRTLRIEHRRIIDTVHVFPHPNGLPYRFSLKRLAEKVLGVFVQTGTDGHDSLEDARTCIHLVQRKMDKGDTIVILA